MTYKQACETFRFARRNEHFVWPLFGFIMAKERNGRSARLEGSAGNDEGSEIAPQAVEIARNGLANGHPPGASARYSLSRDRR
jgi:hypothetical protein